MKRKVKTISFIIDSLIISTFFFGFKLIPSELTDKLGDAATYQTSGNENFKAVVYIYINYISDILFGFLSFVAVGFVIWGGFLYLTSAGNQSQMDKAKGTLTYAVAGIIVILLSSFAVKLVIKLATTGSIL